MDPIVVVPGRLDAVVTEQVLERGEVSLRLATFTSSGLLRHSHPEVRVTVPVLDETSVPHAVADVCGYFGGLLDLARRGGHTRPGFFTGLGGRKGLFGRPDFAGVLYAPVLASEGGGRELQAVFVTNREVEVGRRTGALRVFARMAADARFVPWPWWVQPDRPEVTFPSPSILDRVLSTCPLGARVTVDPGITVDDEGAARLGPRLVVHVRLGPTGRNAILELRRPLAPEQPLALLPPPHPETSALLAWDGGDPRFLHAGDPRCVYDACFCILSPAVSRGEGVQLAEDGVAILLTGAHWRELWGSVARGYTFRAILADGAVVTAESAVVD